jgi:hypothetical protein
MTNKRLLPLRCAALCGTDSPPEKIDTNRIVMLSGGSPQLPTGRSNRHESRET